MKAKIDHTLNFPLSIILYCVLLSFISFRAISQCTGVIASFPYNEDFETSNGNWAAGGNFSDWQWGWKIFW